MGVILNIIGYQNQMDIQIEIGRFIEKRHRLRQEIIKNQRMARPLTPAPALQGCLFKVYRKIIYNLI